MKINIKLKKLILAVNMACLYFKPKKKNTVNKQSLWENIEEI